MIANIQNEDFGYSVADDGDWAAVGNPSKLRFDPLSESYDRSGSVEVYKYNINTDVHDIKRIIYRPLTAPEEILLSTEGGNIPPQGPENYIQTEYTGTIPYTADRDLLVDVGQNFTASEDGYGWAIDLRGNLLAVGCPYFTSKFTFPATESFVFTGSGFVDIYDLSVLDIDPYAQRISPSILGTGSVGGYVTIITKVPPNQNYTYAIFQTKPSGSLASSWINVAIIEVSNSGGTFTIQTTYPSINASTTDTRVVGVISTNPYLLTINNPDNALTNSFGYSVSLNDEWLAVGSPLESGSRGSVFMFRKINGNELSWSFIQTLPVPSDIGPGDNFGSDIGMNKASSSFSWSMIVGSNKPSQSKAYIYEFDGTKWNNNYTLRPDSSSIYPLTFYPTLPIVVNYPNQADSFGHAVSMYGDEVVVGAPTDRTIQEYEGSSLYQQGAVYFFDRCHDRSFGYLLARKSYGNDKIMKNNRLGWSVAVYDTYAVAGIPKINFLSSSICYLQGSLFQEHFCGNPEEALCGQYGLWNKVTGSISGTPFVDWDLINIYQIKKRYLSPYRVFGWDVDVCKQFVIVGSPMLIYGDNTVMSFFKEAPFGDIVLSVHSGSAILNWTYDVPNSEQDGFNVEKSLDSVNYFNIDILQNPDSRSFTDTNVAVSNTYWYRVNAYNNLGVSNYSNTASITFYPQPPGGPIVLAIDSGSALVHWTYTDTTQAGWNVEKSSSASINYANIAVIANPSSRSFIDPNVVSNNSTYWYRVNAYDAFAQTSSYSNTASIFFSIPKPSGSIALSVVTGSLISQSMGSGSSDLTWVYLDNRQDGFNIEKSSSLGFIPYATVANPMSRSYSDTNVLPNTTYWYRVNAYNGYGTSSYSNIGSASFSNVLYFSGSSKFYIDPVGYINESNQSWKSCFGHSNVHLTHLDVSNNSLKTLNLISASSLTVLTCSNNQLTSLDVKTCPSLYWLNCGSNLLTSLDVTRNVGLSDLICYYNQLTTLDCSKLVSCGYIDCGGNLLTSLNVSGSGVVFLYAGNNQLSNVDFDHCNSLSWLNVQNNLFTTMSIGHRSASLQVLGIDNNPLGGVFDLTVYPNLSTLYANNLLLTTLDFSKSPLMGQVQCYGNSFSSLNLTTSSCSSSMWYLDCSINGNLKTLDMSHCPNLSILSCHQNNLSASLFVSSSVLTILSCAASNIQTMSLSGSPNLITMSCDYNPLTSLDISTNPSMSLLSCSFNLLSSSVINQILMDLDTFGFNSGSIYMSGSNQSPTGLGVTARNNLVSKKWLVIDSSGTYS